MPKYIAIMIVSTVLLFGACGTSPSMQEIPMPDQTVDLENPNLARIYLFRNDQEWGTTHYVTIYQDNERLGMIGEEELHDRVAIDAKLSSLRRCKKRALAVGGLQARGFADAGGAQ